MRGRLAVLSAYKEPLELREYDVPDPDPGAIVLRVSQAAICGSDLHMYRGDSKSPLPASGRAMGHEGVGVIHKLGDGVTADAFGAQLQEGDRIIHSVITWGCQHCQLCLMGEHNLCTGKMTAPPAGVFPYFLGMFADYYYVPPGMPVPEIGQPTKTPSRLAKNTSVLPLRVVPVLVKVDPLAVRICALSNARDAVTVLEIVPVPTKLGTPAAAVPLFTAMAVPAT